MLQNHPTALPGQVVPWALPAMKEARRRRMLPTDAQVVALVNAAESFVNPERWSPVRWGVVTRLLVEGGLRRDEMCWLQWGDVATGDLEHATVTIQAKAGWSPKSYASRVVPLRRETAEALAEWRRSLPADLAGAASFLMVHGKKRPHRYGGWPRKCWAAICDAAEVHVQPHALRHLCTVRLFRAHLDPASIRDIMGHADVETTIGVYMRWAPEDHMERAWAALPAAIQGQAS